MSDPQRQQQNPAATDDFWSCEVSELLNRCSSRASGLSTNEARQRLRDFGPNTLLPSARISGLRLLLKQFSSPLVLILLFAAVISAAVREWSDAVIIIAIVLASALITFVQEFVATAAVEKLRAQLAHHARVVRDGATCSVIAEEVVPGDILLLSAGTLVAADGRLLEAKDLYVNQSTLTGETFPAEKHAAVVAPTAALQERSNCVFMGTNVRSGIGRVLVVRTGERTAYGEVAKRLSLVRPETEFEQQIRRFGYMLMRVMVGLVFTVFALNLIAARPSLDVLLFAMALAVGISPELLPAIIAINLSHGARVMARRGVIVRRLEAIEDFGSMDVLCTDKTGTLTEGSVELTASVDIHGHQSAAIARWGYINAALQTGLANVLDEAILKCGKFDISTVSKLDEIPYDFSRKRICIVCSEAGSAPFLIMKGAFANVLAVCSTVYVDGQAKPLDSTTRRELESLFFQWSTDGIRVLALATKSLERRDAYGVEIEEGLMFSGFLLFFDPPKRDAREAIAGLAALGVRLKIVTGDNQQVTEHVAKMVNLPVEGVLTGSELSQTRDEALFIAVQRVTLFVEMDPNQKDRVIQALRRTGHVVGYMGDGINDAPALHDADVGISVQGAVEVARESADFVLLEPDLNVLQQGIKEGRTTLANSLKYIFTTTSANFGNMLSMAAASAFLPFLPLLATQILLNNFLSDLPALAIAGDRVDDELISRPYRWNIKVIQRFMIIFGLTSSFFDFLTFAVLLWVVKATPEVFRTGWFIESLLTELSVALVLRTHRPFYRSIPGRSLAITTAVIFLLTLSIPYLPFSARFGFVPLSAELMLLILAITGTYIFFTELIKRQVFAPIPATQQASAARI